MKFLTFLNERLKGLTNAIARYPLTTIFLLLAVVINAIDIQDERDFSKALFTLVVGVFLSAVSQAGYERFFIKTSARYILMGVVIILTGGYYFVIAPASTLGMEIMIRTAVALFALLFAFIWVPVMKSKISFNKSFMITFKSIFNSLLFSGVICVGMMIIITAIDQLIFTVDYKVYSHAANIIFTLFAPMYFLSLIPVFPGNSNKNQEEIKNQTLLVQKAAKCPKFFEILISYIIIPLISIFTVILLIYIIQNIGGEFWSNNLLEPMIVSYSITVIVIYLLASEIENRFTVFFRKVLPKVLIPIVVFQIISSVLSLGDTGITHTRYYVILYGLFAAIAGCCLSFLPVRKNGVVAALLIIFSVFSILPPVDAFTISKSSQRSIVEKVLIENDMLENNTVQPNGNISNEDKKVITAAMNYLHRMDYAKDIEWLPNDFDYYEDFSKTFGFQEYYEQDDRNEFVYVALEPDTSIPITGYDAFVRSSIYFYENDKNDDENVVTFEKNGEIYMVFKEVTEDGVIVKVQNEEKAEVLRFQMQEIIDKFYDYQSSKEFLPIEELTFMTENEQAAMKIIPYSINIDKMQDETNFTMELYLFIQMK